MRVEQAAKREGMSINTWLVRAAAAAIDGGGGTTARRTRKRSTNDSDHVVGWMG